MPKQNDVNLRKPNILKLVRQTYEIDLNWQKATLICELRHLICECTWRITDSNRWPLRCDRSTLPTELIPLNLLLSQE